MKKQHGSTLWWNFVTIIFTVLGVLSLILGGMFLLCYGSGNDFFKSPFIALVLFASESITAGSAISFFVGKRILNPLGEISAAASAVAKGDFSIRLTEEQPIGEISDITKNFNVMVQELGSIETLRTDFIVNVSHEFKTPIAAIEGYATLLQDENLTREEHDEYTRMIIESTKQLSTLTGNILKISKLENQEYIADKTEFRLDEQIRLAILQLESEWSKKELNLNIDLQKVLFYGNHELCMQVWSNLLGNAVKFAGQHGNINISLIAANGFVQVIISDDGPGMSESVQKHIFEKFYQGDNARSRKGNGLGLPLVKRIIDLCGGEISVESSTGNGATFMVRLPGASS